MIEERYFHEDDELTDEEYFTEEIPSVLKEEEIEDEISDEDDEEESLEQSEEEVEKEAIAVFGDDDYYEHEENDVLIPNSFKTYSKKYKPSGFTNAFLRCELDIKIENFKTICTFSYDGELYNGKVLKKINKDEYIFDVEKVMNKNEKSKKFLKKIYIPDASFISGKPYTG